MNDIVLAWTMFGDCGEIRFEALRVGTGIQCRLLNEGSLLSADWLQDAAMLLQRSAEVRGTLKRHGFRARATRTAALHGGLSWGPTHPPATIVTSLPRPLPAGVTYCLSGPGRGTAYRDEQRAGG